MKQKILAEIERYKKLIGDPLLSDNDLIIGERNACNHIIKLINSLPEEPEFTIDKDVSQMADEFAKREYELDGYERKWLSKGYYHGYMDANKSKPEEPVSEELEEAAKDYFEHAPKDQVHLITDAFKNGAKWDREKIINKVVEWLKENVHKYADSFVDSFELCKDLKQILGED